MSGKERIYHHRYRTRAEDSKLSLPLVDMTVVPPETEPAPTGAALEELRREIAGAKPTKRVRKKGIR